MKLILCDTNITLCKEWEALFAQEKNVEVINARFEDVEEYDCLVSPANSFGLMDGGMDAAIIKYFGPSLAKNVRIRIAYEFCNEQPVGTSVIVPTGNEKHPWLAHTPTMRVPQNIQGTDNVYNAMRAMLIAVQKGTTLWDIKEEPPYQMYARRHVISSVLCPGLGTCTGQMTEAEAAWQMYCAWRNTMYPYKVTWEKAYGIDRDIRGKT